MKFFVIAGWLVMSLALLAPAARGGDAATEAHAEGKSAGEEIKPQGAEEPAGEGKQIETPDDEDSKEPLATRSEVEAVHAEVEVLRDQWQRSLDKNVVQSKRTLLLSGIGQLRYNQLFNNDNSNPKTFSVNFFSLNFTGSLRKDYEQGKNLDYALGLQTGSNLTVSVTDAWLSYQIFNSLDKEGPRLSITAGQQKKNFGLEATATEAFKPTIVGAQFATALSLDERDIGLVLAGDLLPKNDYGYNYRVPLVNYYLGVINGTGPNKLDDNSEKDVFGRLVFNAPVNYNHILRGLSLGGSYYYGRKTYTATTKNTATVNTNTTPPISTTISLPDTSTTRNGRKERWGVDLAYVNTPIGFTLEYVRGKDLAVTNGAVRNGTTVTPVGFKPVEEEGYTFTLFYNFGDQFVNAVKQQDRYNDWYPLTYQPFFRYDRFTPDTSHTNTHTDIYTIGFNWFFAETTKLQINYNIKKEYPVDKSNDQLLVQFQFGF